jgi:hypothetical protein
MKPRLVIANVLLLVLAGAAWRLGLLDAFPALGPAEKIMLVALGCLFVLGLICAFQGRFGSVSHIANTLPVWGLGFTGMGVLLAVAQMGSLSPEALTAVFRNLAFSVAPNIVAVIAMGWLKTVTWWACHEDV